MLTKFTNCHLCDNGEILYNTDLYVDTATGKIVKHHGEAATTVDLGGRILAPGYIDIQNNGVYGLNFSALNELLTADDVAKFRLFYRDAMAKLLSTGVTSLCPTVTSSVPSVYAKVLPMYKRLRLADMVDSLGAHCEGPFISKDKKGCHPVETLVDAAQGMAGVYGNLDNVAIVTAAPEIAGVLDLIPELVSKDVVFSIGHTLLDHATALKALERGATLITHLYNAMPQPHHRDAGVVGLLTLPRAGQHLPHFGLICDGVHVDPSMAVLAYKANPDKCVLVTDAMHLTGLPDGAYQWDGRTIIKDGAQLKLEGTDTLAGASTDLAQCVRNLAKWGHISLAEAVKTCTNNAAALIGATHKGSLRPGCDADLVVLDAEGHVQDVYKLGQRVRPRELSQL